MTLQREQLFLNGILDLKLAEFPLKMNLGKDAQNVQKITDLIKENPRTTLLELEQDTGISKTTIGRIVTKDLKLKKTPAKFIPRFLINEQKLCRLATCENMLEMTRTDPEWKDKIITGDETWVYDYDPETKRQYAEWRGQGEPGPKKSRILKSRNKVLLVAFLDNKGIVHHEYLPAGQTVIKEMYLDILRHLREAIRKKIPEKWPNGIVRTEKFEALKRGLKSQQSLFTKVKTEQEAATRASFRVALEIAKRGKPFTDGEMIKECIIAVVEEMCPEKVNLLKTISMSANTVARRVENIAVNISSQLFDKNGHVEWFSLTLDESTDVSDTAQVLIYIRGVDKSYEVHEELLDMYSIHGTTTGTDIFKGVEMAINKKNLRWKNLKCITTDGGKNMSGKDKGVVALVSKAVENDGGSKPLVLHCIIHQQSLCGKCLDMSDVLKPVISTVNFIRSFGLNHRQFRQFIAEIGETDLIILPYAGLVVGKSFSAFLNFEQ
ncbi:EPM2AIP1 [Cordylochernes scorpioides]|uniref:EPM2AIP1 n=1 Tax=Cordylochernes scorpioides TaxID=51811 RepID=A0ABY6LCW7_9ARAC|nr:EPM2AIP1 [Cordylochernes scorpioides]